MRLFSRTWFLAAIAATMLVAGLSAPTPAAAVNLLTNPGFESSGGSYSGWFTFGSGVQLSLPTSDNIAHDGLAASKVYGGFNGCPGAPAFNVGGYGQAFTPTVGKVYEFSGFSLVSSVDPMIGTDTCNKNRMIAKVVFFNAVSGGAELASNEIVIGDGNSIQNFWQGFSVSAPCPSGALRVEALILFLQPGCDGGSVFVDDLSLTEATPASEANLLANPSFGSGLAGWSTFGNVYFEGRSYLVRTPSGAAKLFSTFVADSPSGLFQSYPASPGQTWRFSLHTLDSCRENPINLANDNFLMARIVFKDAGGVELGGQDAIVLDRTSPLGAWQYHAMQAVNAPAGTASASAYVLFISPTLQGGAAWIDDLNFHAIGAADVPDAPRPAIASLGQNMPNPFGATTRIDFTLNRPGEVTLSLFDVSGRRVATLVDGALAAGPHTVNWNGTSVDGTRLAAGIYRYVLTAPDGRQSKTLLLIR